MGKIDLIKDRCIGCGACMSIAPDNFTFDDDGRAELINKDLTNNAIEASETCPVSAIVIEKCCNCHEECTCDDNCNCDEDCSCGDDCNCNEDNKCCEKCHCNE